MDVIVISEMRWSEYGEGQIEDNIEYYAENEDRNKPQRVGYPKKGIETPIITGLLSSHIVGKFLRQHTEKGIEARICEDLLLLSVLINIAVFPKPQ